MCAKGAKMKKLLLTLLTVLVLNLAWAGPEDDKIAARTIAALESQQALLRSLIRQEALKGNARSQYGLGRIYYKGQGVVKDYAEAVKWYELAAQQGYAPAQSNLGALYANGQGVEQDYAEAVKWYRLAAQQGDVSGQSNLGAMYAEGKGVAQDYVKAYGWFNLGAVKGDAHSIKNHDVIAKKMTTQQIAEAQKLARDCQSRQFKGCD
jgi:TPR repeat protein